MPTTEAILRYRSEGQEDALQKARAIGQATDTLTRSQAENERIQARLAATYRAGQADLANYQRFAALAANANDQLATSASRAASAIQAGAQQEVQANAAKAESLSKVGSAFAAAGEFALKHPILVAAGSVAAARALSGYAAGAAVSLASAYASTARYAEAASGMGGAVAAGAALAARGLSGMSGAASAASSGLGVYAEKVAEMTTVTSLLSRGLSLLPGFLGPLAAAFAVFEVGSAVMEKASSDLGKLIELATKAQALDVSPTFMKAFESIGTSLRLTIEQMDAALGRAAEFVKDRFGEFNQLEAYANKLQGQGYNSAGIEGARQQISVAQTNEERIKAGLALMQQLEAAGYRFAELDLAGKLFGPEIVERLRTGETSSAQIAANLAAAAQQKAVDDATANRAKEVADAIARTKQEITDALGVSISFADVSLKVSEAWLTVLGTVKDVAVWIGDALIPKAQAFISTLASGVVDVLTKLGKAQADAEMRALTGQGIPEVERPRTDWNTRDEASKWSGRTFSDDHSGRSNPYQFDAQVQAWKKAQSQMASATREGTAAVQQQSDAYDNAIKRAQDQTAELKLQAEMAGRNTEEVYKLTESNRLWRAATQAGRQDQAGIAEEIDRVSTALAQQHVTTDRTLEAQRRLQEGTRELAGDFAQFADDVILGGQKMGEAFQSLSKSLASSGLKAILTGEGPLAGILGTANPEKGQLGGLLGMSTQQFRGLIGDGFKDGLSSALQGPNRDGSTLDTNPGGYAGKAGGLFSGPLGQGLAAAGLGASVGYSSQNPLLGAGSGLVAGLMTGNPLIGAAGAAAGLCASEFKRKDRSHVDGQRRRLPPPRRDAHGRIAL